MSCCSKVTNQLFFSVREEITDVETFSLLDNNDFVRLHLTTKMVKTIQKYQKLLENDLEPEEEEATNKTTTDETNVPTCSNAAITTNSINLEKVCICNVNYILQLIYFLLIGN